jgi:hypothetical protein
MIGKTTCGIHGFMHGEFGARLKVTVVKLKYYMFIAFEETIAKNTF